MPAPRRLYFDNAATSFPKPSEVAEAVRRYIAETGASPGRGAYREAVQAGAILNTCRDRLCRLFNGESAEHVIFTLHTTDALNIAIKGVVNQRLRANRRAHVITTTMDHNSILRPFTALEERGVEVTRVQCDPKSGLVDPADIQAAIGPDTCLVATIHGSNVSGTIQPIADIGAGCREANVLFLVDAAQTLGHLPVDVQQSNIDLLAFPGHKGLLGPLGTGGLYIRPGVENQMDTVREGGTGTRSESDRQPRTMPDRFEPGSHNAPGIAGLSEGVKWILDRGVDQLWRHEQSLIRIMLEGLREIPGLTLLGPDAPDQRCGVFTILIEGLDPFELATILEDSFGILVRPGLHCAPLAHQSMGTTAEAQSGGGGGNSGGGGAVRLSLGPFLAEADVRYAVDALSQVARTAAPALRSAAS